MVEAGEINPREAKDRLAREVVEVYHGLEEAKRAADEFRRVFSRKELPEEMPVARLSRSGFSGERVWVVDLLISLGLAASKGEARRLVEGGGVAIDGEKVIDSDLELAFEEVDNKVIRKGRKTFIKVEIVGDL
jgi:tyrosyl-tRNA synthetase